MGRTQGGGRATLAREGDGQTHAGVHRVLRMIDAVSRSGRSLTAKGLAQELGMSLSTCYGLLNVLIEEGYVEKLPRHGGYRLGPVISLLHERRGKSEVAGVVEPVIRELSQRSGRYACFALLVDGDATLTQVEAPPRVPPLGIARGFRGAAHALAVGKVLVAGTGPRGVSEYLETHALEPFTTKTIVDPVQLEVHLRRVRQMGLATSLGEFTDNLFDVAVPLEAQDASVRGAIGLFTTTRRSSSEVGPLTELARRAAHQAAALVADAPAFSG